MTHPTMKPTLSALSSLAGFPILWLLSALLHTTDADVEGIAGLASPAVLQSVTAIAVVFFLPALAAIALYRRAGRRAYAAVLLATSAGLAFLVTALGSGATDLPGRALSFAGVAALCATVYLLATLPAILTHSRKHTFTPAA